MAQQYADRVRETTTTTGNGGVYALGGAVDSYQSFADGITNGNSCYYCCISESEFEIGSATFTSPSTLTRDSILQTSALSDAAIDWASGTKHIFQVLPESIITLLEAHRASTSNPHDTTLEKARTAGATFAGDVSFGDNKATAINLEDYFETKQAVTSSSNAVAIDYTAGQVVTHALTENTTIGVPSNLPASGTAASWTLILTQHASTGPYTVAYNAAYKWGGGSSPTMSTGASDVDVVTCMTVDAGTTIYAFSAGQDMS